MSVVFAVPPDVASGSVRQINDKEITALNAHHYSLEDVLVVAALLAKVPKFPMDMVGEVLAMADFLVFFEGVTHEDRRGHDNMNEVYLELSIPEVDDATLPHGVAILPQCMGLVVECTSRDQGWASDAPQHNHTYNASHTWTEIAVAQQQQVNGNGDGDAATTLWNEVARTTFTPNFRASREPRHHLKEFKDPHGLLQHIAFGSKVQLILRSQYPAWSNHASYGRIRARFALDICEDAKLPSIAQFLTPQPAATVTQSFISTLTSLFW